MISPSIFALQTPTAELTGFEFCGDESNGKDVQIAKPDNLPDNQLRHDQPYDLPVSTRCSQPAHAGSEKPELSWPVTLKLKHEDAWQEELIYPTR